MFEIGDSITREALATGRRSKVTASGDTITIAITLPDGDVQHFERPAAGSAADWRVTTLTSSYGGAAFDEPAGQAGEGLEVLARSKSPEPCSASHGFPRGADVTLAAPPREPGSLRLFGTVLGGATDPFTGDRLVMVLWDGVGQPRAHKHAELVIVD
ncbi:hypothetical protein CIB93_13885 [Streptomyces sp. WZ.A104]|uniref:hypothetical protein n=1 Tax=Streptomyces sp. WZ.A104 TaxID=2023771 RepID=UPI000BBC473B|nr:hypothetical protein [Streptomyces sp. WZ.A104]PCG85441.1 hypothetical protein CIB93_13885 [Streptomyces sp. WZ.A104]